LGTCPIEFTETAHECNLYLWEAGSGIHFITRLGIGGTEKVSDYLDWEPTPSRTQDQRQARVSRDGKVLVFRSQLRLTSYDNAGIPEFYRYEVGGEPQCITCNPTGAAPETRPSLFSIQIFGAVNAPPELSRNLAIAGNRFFFETGDKLLPTDTNGDAGCPQVELVSGTVPRCQDVYEWEASGTGSCQSGNLNGGCLSLISTGLSLEPSYFADSDLEGDNAFFYTLDQLVGQDKDQLVDIYDARVDGGLPSQFPVSQSPCIDQVSCKGPTPPPPTGEGAPGSTGVTGTLKPPPLKCRRGFMRVRRHGKAVCLKRKSGHGKGHHKRRKKNIHHKAGGSK
jgi:hypothetical protein